MLRASKVERPTNDDGKTADVAPTIAQAGKGIEFEENIVVANGATPGIPKDCHLRAARFQGLHLEKSI